VAPSVVITALLAGLARLALDYARAGGLSTIGIWFGGGGCWAVCSPALS
jgi:hypothetical protein